MAEAKSIWYIDKDGVKHDITGDTITITPSVVDLVVEDENKNKINIDNGERVIRGNAIADGGFISCNGIWMQYNGSINTNNFVNNTELNQSYVSKLYSSFFLPKDTKLYSSNNELLGTAKDNFEFKLSFNSGTTTISVTTEVNKGFDNFNSDSTQFSILDLNMSTQNLSNLFIITHIGFYFKVTEIISDENYLYGGVKCQIFPMGIQKKIEDETYYMATKRVKNASFDFGQPIVLKTQEENSRLEGTYLTIPFKSYSEFLYATGISEVFTKKSIQELKDEYGLNIVETNENEQTEGDDNNGN